MKTDLERTRAYCRERHICSILLKNRIFQWKLIIEAVVAVSILACRICRYDIDVDRRYLRYNVAMPIGSPGDIDILRAIELGKGLVDH